jgi:citrate lyase beta subunit
LESADGDAARFEGAMIDRPVIEAARQTVESGERIARRLAQMQERT